MHFFKPLDKVTKLQWGFFNKLLCFGLSTHVFEGRVGKKQNCWSNIKLSSKAVWRVGTKYSWQLWQRTPKPMISRDEEWFWFVCFPNLKCRKPARKLSILTASLCQLHTFWIYFPPSLSSVYSQPIICKAGADLLRTHFLPTLDKLKKKTVKVQASNIQDVIFNLTAQCSLSFKLYP